MLLIRSFLIICEYAPTDDAPTLESVTDRTCRGGKTCNAGGRGINGMRGTGAGGGGTGVGVVVAATASS